jgi:hypothetical protein
MYFISSNKIVEHIVEKLITLAGSLNCGRYLNNIKNIKYEIKNEPKTGINIFVILDVITSPNA